MKIGFEHLEQSYSLELAASGKMASATGNGETVSMEILHAESGHLDLLINGQPARAYISADGPRRWVTLAGQTFLLTKTDGQARRARHAARAAGQLTAPMPGLVRAVQVQEGESVAAGQTLVIVEAMKMELKVNAPQAGRVKSLSVRPGQTVERDQILAEIE